ncbi:hypothetical protein [Bradyrhizobium sp. CCBAU 53351]|uniref:hypothetical protein n=1 Tax=Bradyrhizobium sp. CCBAU 53351 TaxID=1325114 RepID=UPI001FEE66EC|nr:hypothetical protein [Bradyrhizobium sp. CCBAU 53351]
MSSRTSVSIVVLSAQAEERQHRHDHDDQADQVNQSVHSPILLNTFLLANQKTGGTFLNSASVAERTGRMRVDCSSPKDEIVSTRPQPVSCRLGPSRLRWGNLSPRPSYEAIKWLERAMESSRATLTVKADHGRHVAEPIRTAIIETTASHRRIIARQ